jgi:peptidoglycan hydrolase-like protein with peptidoglycan-binding domain
MATSSGLVDTNTVGTYLITYTAEDSVLNIATTTRTVNINPVPIISNPDNSHSGGGGGTSGYITPKIIIPTTTDGLVLGTSTFRFLKNLSLGMSNNDINELQLRLIREGYLKVSATGYFGPKTLLAVKAHQSFYNLPTTGYFGPLTRTLMNGETNDENSVTQINRLMEQLKSIQNMLNVYLSLPKN